VYTPRHNLVEDEAAIRRMVAEARTAWFVTTGADGFPQATFLPIVWRESTVVAHLARANRQWRGLAPDAAALLIVTGPDAYISPSWYERKRVDGKVVPTWDYSAVHLTGTVRVHEDAEWLRTAVTELTETHEAEREHPWAVTDAPADHIDRELSGIVGIEFTVIGVEGKAKLNQNYSEADRRSMVEALAREPFPGAAEVAAQVASTLTN
jgi:Transcriptional regulator